TIDYVRKRNEAVTCWCVLVIWEIWDYLEVGASFYHPNPI
ncbi:hypothetical protein TorRG33x02_095400, partial [Trema orientale]